MKTPRVLLLAAAVVVLLLIATVVVAFNSSFQTWAARRALASRPDIDGSIGSIAAGLHEVALRDIRLETQGAVLTLPSLDARLSLVAAGLSDDVRVSSLVAKGWTLDLSKVENLAALGEIATEWRLAQREPARRPFSLLPSAYAAQPDAAAFIFQGLLTQLRLPVDLSLDGVVLEGEVVLPANGGGGAARVKLNLQGGGLAAGREGSFTLDLAAAKSDGGALTLHSTLAVTMDTPRTFTRVASQSAASASGTQLPTGVKLDIDAKVVRNAAGENYVLLIASEGKSLADIQAALATATSRIAGTWKLDLRDSDLEPFVLGRPLPTFTVEGQGGLETGTTFDEIHGNGSLTAFFDRLEVILPELAAVGPTNLKADFDLLQHGDSLRIERLNATVSAAAPIAVVQALQPFEFNLRTAELRVADPARDLVGISLSGLPVAWARPFLGDLELTGGDLRGEFAASARDGGLALRARTPLTIAGVSLASGGEPWLRAVDVSLTASADYTPQGWQAEVVQLGIRSAGVTLLSLDAKAGQLAGEKQPVKVTGQWSADLPGWLTQPILAEELQLLSGTAQGEFSASLDGLKAVDTKLSLTNLVAPTRETLPTVMIELRADVAEDGAVTFNAPMTFDRGGRKSDLLLAGTLTPGATVSTIDARLTGERVEVEDVQMLALLIPAGPAEEPKQEDDGDAPFWSKINGQVTLALKKVVYGGTFEVSDVGGTLRIDPAALRLDGVSAAFGPESDLKISGGVNYDAQATESYALAANLALNNFDTAPAFRALNPAKLPTVEARLNVNGQIAGRGVSLVEAAEQARGRFDVSSKGGVFRALSTVLPSDRLQAAAPTALSIVGGLLGGSAGETLNATAEIVKIISEIPFDQLSFKAERDQTLNLILRDFALISPDARLGGTGMVTYAPDKPLLQQALDVQLTLAARGRLGELLGQVKMLKAEKDSLGYTAFTTPIKIGGTLAQTDTRDLQTKLLNIALEKTGLGEAIDKILGGGK